MGNKCFSWYSIIVVALVFIILAIKIVKHLEQENFKSGAFWMWSTIEKNHYYPAPFEITYRATLLEYHKSISSETETLSEK